MRGRGQVLQSYIVVMQDATPHSVRPLRGVNRSKKREEGGRHALVLAHRAHTKEARGSQRGPARRHRRLTVSPARANVTLLIRRVAPLAERAHRNGREVA